MEPKTQGRDAGFAFALAYRRKIMAKLASLAKTRPHETRAQNRESATIELRGSSAERGLARRNYGVRAQIWRQQRFIRASGKLIELKIGAESDVELNASIVLLSQNKIRANKLDSKLQLNFQLAN